MGNLLHQDFVGLGDIMEKNRGVGRGCELGKNEQEKEKRKMNLPFFMIF